MEISNQIYDQPIQPSFSKDELLEIINEVDLNKLQSSKIEEILTLKNTQILSLFNKLSKVYENIDETFFCFDFVQQRTTYISNNCVNLFGFNPEEFYSNSNLLFDCVFREDKSLAKENEMLHIQNKPSVNIIRIVNKNDSIKWVEMKTNPTLNENAELIELNGIIRDISENVEKENLLKENEIKFKALVENSAEAFVILTPEGYPKYVSPSIDYVLGYTAEEALKLNLFELIHPDDQEVLIETWNTIISNPGKTVQGKPGRMKNKKGEWRWLDSTSTNMLHDPTINGIIDNFRDITDTKLAHEALAESEKMHRSLFEQNPMPIFVLDLDTLNFLTVNESAIKEYGYSKEEFLKMSSVDLRPEEDKELFLNLKRDNQNNPKDLGVWRHIKKDGSLIFVEIHASSITYQNKKARLVLTNNVTEKVLSEKEHEKTKNNFKSLIENTDTAFLLLNKEGKILTTNHKSNLLFEKILNSSNVIGRNFFDLLNTEVKILLLEKFNLVVKNGEKINYETKCKLIAGGFMYLKFNLHPIFDFRGEIIGLSGSAVDITEHKKNEKLISEANKRYEYATKATNDVIWDWDITQNTMYRSENFKLIFGYDQAENNVYSKSWINHVHEEDKKRIIASIEEALSNQNNNVWENEYRYYRASGELAIVHDRGFIIHDNHNAPVRMVGAMRDITNQKIQQVERDKMTTDLIQRNKDLEQFAYIVSHNLRAPLANIKGLTTLIQIPDLRDEIFDESVHGLKESVNKLDEVIMDLNYILQIKRDLNEKKEWVNLTELIEDIKIGIYNNLKKENTKIITEFENPERLYTLKSYLFSIFINLITNSIKYKKPDVNPIITIKSKIENDQIILTYNDNGSGIDLVKNGDKVFGLYKKFNHDVEGKGMGLFMVKTQIEALGGKISIDSEPLKGITFTIVFEKQNI